MHVLAALIFIKIGLKLRYFCQKNTNFLAMGDPFPDPRVFDGFAPRPPIASGG